MLHSITLLHVTIIPCTPLYRITLHQPTLHYFTIVLWHVVTYHVALYHSMQYLPIPKYPTVTILLQLQYIHTTITLLRVVYIYITHFYVFASYNVLINTIPRFIYIYIFIRSKANLRNRSIVFIVIPLSRLTLKNSIYSSEYTNSVTAPPCLFSSIANNRYSQSKG